jgi:hypothetical protein
LRETKNRGGYAKQMEAEKTNRAAINIKICKKGNYHFNLNPAPFNKI